MLNYIYYVPHYVMNQQAEVSSAELFVDNEDDQSHNLRSGKESGRQSIERQHKRSKLNSTF